jgi:sulfate/thiosulfate transport system ATP-binding protein
MSVAVAVKNLEKSFGRYGALRGVSFEVSAGELLGVLGPSGSGKTTLLRAIAGLEMLDGGQVFFDDVDSNQLTLREKRIGFVFQHYALFRHMTVMDNIAFGLRAKPRNVRPTEQAIRAKVQDLLSLVQLDRLEDRYPAQLSGGQRQRVALARALAIEPRVLLLDEPFGALDAQIRKELRQWLRALHDRTHHTTLFVTHDQDEAFELGDRIAVLRGGKIEQIGTKMQITQTPATTFVADFIQEAEMTQAPVPAPRKRKLFWWRDGP